MNAFSPFSVHIVRGHSMQPLLKEGCRVVAFKWAYLFSQPKVNDVVVFKGSDGMVYVKRVTAAINKNEFSVEGDNTADSLKTPSITKEQILGKVVAIY